MNTEDKIKSFERELNTITDENLRKFAMALLSDTEDWFYHEPASTSGKYHPKFALGDGGLMRHTQCVVYFLNELLRTELFKVNEREADLLRIAAIAHDIRKHEHGRFVSDHPQRAAVFIRYKFSQNCKLLDQTEVDYICKAVESHMGKWLSPMPETDAEKLLHLADYCASRKEFPYAYEDSPVITVPSDGRYRFNFGKHNGKTIPEVDAVDHEYIEWIAGLTEFKHEDARKLIIEYLNSKK